MKIRHLDKKTRNFLAMLFCTLVIVSTIGSSFAISTIGNSFAQQQQTQQAPTTAYKSPWSNDLQASSGSNSQPLCGAGICDQSSGPASTKQTANATPAKTTNEVPAKTTNVDPTQIVNVVPTNTINVVPAKAANEVPAKAANVDPTQRNTHVSRSITATSSKPLTLTHQFMSDRVVGSDRFRFIKSFWTSSDVSPVNQLSQLGNSPCPAAGIFNPSAVTTLPATLSGQTTSPFNIEVDRDEGYATLAVILQYQGVAPLTGITAGLRLPSGFQAQVPLTDNRNNYNIALSNFFHLIIPGDSVTLCFPLNVLHNAVVQLPVLGPLALHFLRADPRSINDNMEAIPENIFARAFTNTTNVGNPLGACTSAATAGNCTTTTLGPFTHNLDFKRDYFSHFGRTVLFDYINQVIPIIWKVTGREVLDVSLPTPPTLPTLPITAFPANPLLPQVPGPGNLTAFCKANHLTTGSCATATSNTHTSSGVPKPSISFVAAGGPSGGHSSVGGSTSGGSSAKASTTVVAGVTQGKPDFTKYTNPVRITFNNYGDVALHNLVAVLTSNVTSLVTSAATAQTYPLGIQGQATFHILSIPAGAHRTITVWITTAIGCAAIEPITVSSTYTNAIGQRIAQTNAVTLQIQQATAAAYKNCPVPGSVPGLIEPQLAQ
jgi:hypothetical protein